MACGGAYASAQDYSQYWDLSLDLTNPDTVAEVTRQLTLGAASLHGALAATASCGCVQDQWALDLLKWWNVISTAVFYKCVCGPELSADEKRLYLEWLDRQAELVRTSKLDLCGGTGAEFPAVGTVELNHTDFSAAQIIRNRIQRTGH